MRLPKVETVHARIVENAAVTQKVRLAALEAIPRPSLALLRRLLADPTTPSRLLGLAARRYQEQMLRKEERAEVMKRREVDAILQQETERLSRKENR